MDADTQDVTNLGLFHVVRADLGIGLAVLGIGAGEPLFHGEFLTVAVPVAGVHRLHDDAVAGIDVQCRLVWSKRVVVDTRFVSVNGSHVAHLS